MRIELEAGSAATVTLRNDANELVRTANIPAAGVRVADIAVPGKPGLYRVEVASTEGGSNFCFLALNAATSHPRVLLTSERLEELRSAPYSRELLAAVHRRADDLRRALAYNPDAGQNIALLPDVSVHPGLPQYFSLLDNYGNSIAFNALEFRLTGDRQSLEAARRALLTVAAWSTWTPPWFAAHGLHTYYQVGVFTQQVALGYDLVADGLSLEDKVKIAEALWKNSISPTLEDYFEQDRLPIAVSNHEAQSVGGAIEACVALYGDAPDWAVKFGPALAKLVVVYERLLEGLFPADGSGAEPATYAHFSMEGMSWGMAALHALELRPHGYDRMMRVFRWTRYAKVQPSLVLDTGDSGTEMKVLSGFAWGAEYAGNPALRAYYDAATEKSLRGIFAAPRPPGSVESDTPGLLDLACCSHPLEATAEPELSRIFSERGSAVMRSGWRPEDTVISVRAGAWFNHEHHDQGSFLVAAFGEQLVAEAGGSSYYTDPHYPDFFTQAPAHNTILVDNDAFSQEDYDGRYWAAFHDFPRFVRHAFSPGIDYLTADLTPAYRDTGGIRNVQRDYLFIKPATLIIRDDIQADMPHLYSWFVHPPSGAHTDIASAAALIRGKDACTVLSAAGENRHWTIERQPVPTPTYVDLDRTPVVPRVALRLDSSQQKMARFLVAMHFQKAAEAAVPIEPFQTSSAEGFRSHDATGATTVLFRRENGPLMAGDIVADGAGLVVIERADAEELLAIQVQSLRRGPQTLMSASAPIEAVLENRPSFRNLYLTCASETDLRLFPEKKPVALTVDGVPTTAGITEKFISLAHLAKGEHVLRIAY